VNASSASAVAACCLNCAHFERDARAIEAAFPGLRALSSGFASVRADDGLCARHDRYVAGTARCAQFLAVAG